ncbi:MAG TPA: hypothetical protein DCM87_16920 [Planctomycetes bacterium]|nr:hypothetical protein [Planctomycetota bacterium]
MALVLALCAAAAPEARVTAIVADRVVTVTGGVVENGVILIKNGKIEKIAPRLTPPQGAEVVDAGTLAAYPGMVLARTRIGLGAGQGSVVETLWPYGREYDRIRACGFTALGLVPPGGELVSGLGAVARPLARAKDEIVLGKSEFLCMSFSAGYARTLPGLLRQEGQSPLVQAVQGRLPAVITASDATSVLLLVRILGEHRNLRRYVVPEGDVVNALPVLCQGKVPCIVRATLESRPITFFEHNVAATLARAGAPVCLVPAADSVAAIETFRFDAARLIAGGLPEDAALRAVTINPAAALGIDWRLGSLEAGKDADVVLVDGELLDPRARIRAVYIAGEKVYACEPADAGGAAGAAEEK